MNIRKNISLRTLNTFGIDAVAEYYAEFNSVEDLIEVLEVLLTTRKSVATSSSGSVFSSNSASGSAAAPLILGGGSNILLVSDVPGWVIKNNIEGINVVKEDDEFVYVKSGAGVTWHELVLFAIENGWGGIENLSLIPGKVGAGPMQNIGAYGVEIKDVFHELNALHIYEKKQVKFNLNECEFGYRESVFKRKYKGQFVILDVTLKLRKQPVFNISYGAIEQELNNMGVKQLSLKAISQAVINIRSSKLPDPAKTGNAGSFFKNPTVEPAEFERLRTLFPEIPGYPQADDRVKLAAGWMIEQCGWKGFRSGDAGCHARQALVLVNYGQASGLEIYSLSKKIQQSVYEKFGVMLEPEVNIVPAITV